MLAVSWFRAAEDKDMISRNKALDAELKLVRFNDFSFHFTFGSALPILRTTTQCRGCDSCWIQGALPYMWGTGCCLLHTLAGSCCRKYVHTWSPTLCSPLPWLLKGCQGKQGSATPRERLQGVQQQGTGPEQRLVEVGSL